MKKILALITVISLVFPLFLFSSCGKTENVPKTDAADEQTADNILSVTADKTTVAPGDTVDVRIVFEKSHQVASFQGEMPIPANTEIVENYVDDAGEFIPVDKIEDGVIAFGGIVAKTYSPENLSFYYAQFKVSENAKSGDTIVFNVNVSTFQYCTDAEGNEDPIEIADEVLVKPLTVTVQ